MSEKRTNTFCSQRRVYHAPFQSNIVFYAFELQLAGIILLTAMAAGGISLWLKRRRDKLNQLEEGAKKEEQNL